MSGGFEKMWLVECDEEKGPDGKVREPRGRCVVFLCYDYLVVRQ